ncbi:MAG: DUF763 domain-containing protein [Bacteroidota bacterium]
MANNTPQRSGTADLALMGGGIPPWLFRRMTKLSLHVTEAIVADYGTQGFLKRLSDPFWFQSFGAVIGMDWNSSGVTTAVLRALKTALNPHADDLGLIVCGGKGKRSLQTPHELVRYGDRMGLDGNALARASKLSAKVDNTAVQDGFQLYIHGFVASADGEWAVIQQGMKPADRGARRYHWHSNGLDSFVDDPHAAIAGTNQGAILNLVDAEAQPAQEGILTVAQEPVTALVNEVATMRLPRHHGVRASDVDLKRLGAVLHLAQESETATFEELLLLKGLGPRTLQALALVSEVVHGTPTRFSDPARFTFAHGGKGGTPFPVPTRVYDETIETLRGAVERAKLGQTDKAKALRSLTRLAQKLEDGYTPRPFFDEAIERERRDSWKRGGRTVQRAAMPPDAVDTQRGQLDLFGSG